MTADEYQRICDRLARKAIHYAKEMSADEGIVDGITLDSQREHWIDVFLDEHLPTIDPDVLLEVTSRPGAWVRSGGHPDATKEVRANAAFQADVWGSINQLELNDPNHRAPARDADGEPGNVSE